MKHGYEVEQRRGDGTYELFIARDPATPGPRGVGVSEAEAVKRLEEALESWDGPRRSATGPVAHPGEVARD